MAELSFGDDELACQTVHPDQIRICSCHVIVMDFYFSPGHRMVWDPTHLQRRLIRSLWPRAMVEANGFGWAWGSVHLCCDEGMRPVDEVARINAALDARKQRPRGMGLAGDGTDEGPKPQGQGQGGVA